MIQKEGWNWLINSPKWHYFRDGRSLCGRWMSFTKDGFDTEDKLDHPDNCKECNKRRKKELEKLENDQIIP